MTGVEASKESIKEAWFLLHKSLALIETIWLHDRYLFGSQPSIADLSLACELTELEPMKFNYDKYPKIKKWLYQDMMDVQGFKNVHDIGTKKLNSIVGAIKRKQLRKQQK